MIPERKRKAIDYVIHFGKVHEGNMKQYRSLCESETHTH